MEEDTDRMSPVTVQLEDKQRPRERVTQELTSGQVRSHGYEPRS